MDPSSREDLFRAASILTGPASTSETRPADLKAVLLRRLEDYRAFTGREGRSSRSSLALETAQQETALEALFLLENLHRLITFRGNPTEPRSSNTENDHGTASVGHDASLVGTRDLGLIRTLVSIVFRWAVDPLTQRVVSGIPSTSSNAAVGPRIIDLTGLPQDHQSLSSVTSRLLDFPLSDGISAPLTQSAVSATLLNQHLTDLLPPCIILGWLPKSLSSESVFTIDTIRPRVMYLLSKLPVAQVVSALGYALSKTTHSLTYTRKAYTFILSRQLLRPDGIRGLCESVFVQEDISEENAPLEKLDYVAKLLGTAPSGMKAEEYCNVMIPRMLLILSSDTRALPPTHRRAIAFSLSQMLGRGDFPEMRSAASRVAFSMLHDPILLGTGELSPAATLRTIEVLLTNTDPSPDFVSSLLAPIVPSLYALYAHLEATRLSDPLMREIVKGFLDTWGRLVGASEVVAVLLSIIDGEGGNWRIDVAGEPRRAEESSVVDDPSLSLFTPESLKQAEDLGELDVDSNILGLKPDPAFFVRFVKALGRPDVSSDLFVKLLERYRELRGLSETDPLRTLLYLQLVLQMQKGSVDDTSNVLKKPEHVLTFIKHALENPRATGMALKPRSEAQGIGIKSLRIVPEEADEIDDGDSDDEEEGGLSEQGVDDITSTAVKLLLSVLEANPGLSARSAPVLNEILELLDPLTRVPSEDLRAFAREARMVMTARLASTSSLADEKPAASSSVDKESPQETYQKALKLLQDPLLPVRAHGLLLLRQLVSPGQGLAPPALDSALVPGILAIFLQAVQDDDSYVFLNAVSGLAAMADGYGRDVLRSLVHTYVGGLDDALVASALTKQDVDVRTRVGEALGQVVRRCGEALPAYAEVLVPPLFQVFRAPHVPTVLRTSTISLLAQCVRTNPLAVLPYIVDLADALVDLLRLESVAAQPRSSTTPRSDGASAPTDAGGLTHASKEASEEADKVGGADARRGKKAPSDSEKTPVPPPTMDAQPTAADTKFPPLRRAALHFLALLVRACTSRVYETGDAASGIMLPPQLMTRVRTTLGYVAATDADDVVRVMARETIEGLDQLVEALVGM